MKGINYMEIILISTAITAIALTAIVRIVKPQTHATQAEMALMATSSTIKELVKQLDAIQAIAIGNEAKVQRLNQDILNLIERHSAEIDGLESEIDGAQDHIARLRESVQVVDKSLAMMDARMSSDISVKVQQFAKPLLVKMVSDRNERVYTVEKWRKTKDGYKKMSMSRVLPPKKKETIKKLNLPGTEAAKESFVQSGL